MNILMLEFNLPPSVDCACGMCGVVAACKPYGLNGAYICEECGQKHPEMVKEAVAAIARSVAAGISGVKPEDLEAVRIPKQDGLAGLRPPPNPELN